MESTISTKDLKSKLDQKHVTVVETLAPERYREAHIPGALNIPVLRKKSMRPHAAISSSQYSWCSPPRTSRARIRQLAGNSTTKQRRECGGGAPVRNRTSQYSN